MVDRRALHRACLDRGLLLVSVAHAAGMRPGRLYQISGGYIYPKPAEIARIANLLGVPPDRLLRRDEEPAP